MHPQPKLSLVGAGPGDPDLISLKGIKALQAADVVLYDALASPELLAHAPLKAEKIFVGKRAGKHSVRQQDTNYMIAAYAYAYGHVVRLKGGDPFIFGRGHEEKTYAEHFGIEVEVIPGISSVNSVPASAGIPLTKRGINQSFFVLTGTTKEGKLSADLALAAQTSATIVILMGLRKLGQIVSTFQQIGKGELPVAVISSGTMAEQTQFVGTVNTIEELVATNPPSGPTLIVLGEVVRLQEEFEKFSKELLVEANAL